MFFKSACNAKARAFVKKGVKKLSVCGLLWKKETFCSLPFVLNTLSLSPPPLLPKLNGASNIQGCH